MQVILLERVEKLGQMGDVVTVKPGFARNFLLPKGKALRASAANLKRFETERAQLEARNLEMKSEAGSVAEKLEGQSFVAIRQAGDSGQLYGSDLLTENGFSIARGQVVLDRPIKVLGLHDVRVALHPEVTIEVIVNVARTEEEAERQARGEDVTVERDDEDGLDELELEEVFEDAGTAEGVVLDEEIEAGAADEAVPSGEDETPTDKVAG